MITSKFRLTALSASVAAAIGSAPLAQAQQEEAAIEEVIVTGSYIRRTSFDGTKPVQVVDQAAIERIGASQPVDVLRELTVNSGSQFYNETNNRAGTAMFNVRNLGLGSTLTLINGKRAGIAPVADDSGADYLDINQYPLTMIERIEVLTDGASALYGSQAVAGVANIVTRKGFEGFELSAGHSQSQIEQQDLGLAAGARFGRGGFNIYASLYKQDEAYRSDFDWLNARLNPSPAASRFLSSTGSPGTYRGATLDGAGNAVPTGGNSVPDPDCEAAGGVLRSPGDSRCRYLFVDQVAVISAEERVQVFNEFEWEFSDRLRYSAEASFSSNIVERPSGAATFNTGSAVGGGFTVPASHPFNFFIADPANPKDIVYIGPDTWDNSIHTATDLQATARPLGREVNKTALTQYIKRELSYTRILNGVEFDIGASWSGELSHGWASSTRTTNAPHNYRSDVFQDLVKAGEWNPFGTRLTNPGLVSPKDGASTAGNSDITLGKFDTPSASNARVLEQVTDLVFTGDLFEFNGNTVQAAFGSQFRDVSIEIYGDSLESAGEANEQSLSGPVVGSQDAWAVFGEIVAPATDTLELQFAARREDYGGRIGATVDPKAAFEFRPLDWLGLRGSWGTSFQAPTVRQTAQATSSAFIDDPASPTGPGGSTVCVSTGLNNNVSVAVQGSPDLAPQESENFNLGLVLQLANGFNASLDYFHFDYTDLIAQSEGAQAIVNNDCLDDGIPNDPRVVRDAGGQLRQVNTQFVNIGSVETRGMDLNVAWNFDVGEGNLFVDAAATYVTEFAVSDGAVSFDGAGSRNFRNNFSTLPQLRANAGATWSRGGHSFTARFRHIDEYRNDQSNNGLVEAWNVIDVQYNRVFAGLLGDGGTSVTLGLNNLFGADPPRLTRHDAHGNELPPFRPSSGGVIYDGLSDRPGYDDRAGHDLRGRVAYVRFTQDF